MGRLRRITGFVAAALATAALVAGAQAATITLDFDGVSDGAVISDGTSSTGNYGGISISGVNTGGGPDLAVAYDSGGAIGRDSDLEENRFASNFTNADTGTGGYTGFGNLLIVQENSTGCADGTCDAPDDEAGGGSLRFSFANGLNLRSFDYFDIDGAPDQQAETITVRLFASQGFDFSDAVNGTDVIELDGLISTGGDNTFRTHVLESPQFVYGLEFAFLSSGAIDNIVLETVLTSTETETVPAPAPLAIMLGGIIALGIASRRSRDARRAGKGRLE